ncbi:protease [Neisseria meningitidis]|nr:protease [Neisseria meningitidis]MBG8586740.1 protease [Neisseria meningitidis]MBG8599931.1 protease [Neisseria meningitidis]MBG8608192.1 protease [Neisseria meningitidis]MBG8611147.1 protease [Neisseria meningitidis]
MVFDLSFKNKKHCRDGRAACIGSCGGGRSAFLALGAARFALNGKNNRGATVNFHGFAVPMPERAVMRDIVPPA